MARIYKRNNVWYLDVNVHGRRIRKRVGTSKKLAELALKDAEVKIVREEFGFSKTDIAIDQLIERFLEYSRTNHRPSTTARYRSVTDHLRRYLSEKQPNVVAISQLTPEILEGYKTYRKDGWVNPNGRKVDSEDDRKEYTRRGARGHTISLEMDGIKTMLNVAIRWGYLKDNPMKQVKPLKVEDAKPVRFLTTEEIQRFLAATPPDLYPIYFTFLNTGMRKAELEHLQWADIDFKRRKIRIRRKEGWQPKTGERDIPINDDLNRLLVDLKRQAKGATDADTVFKIGNTVRFYNRLRTELIKIAEKAEIKDLTKVHTLRHTFASHLVMQGVDLTTVKSLMGHSDIKTTMIYAHLSPDHLSDAVNKLQFRTPIGSE